MRSVKLKIYKCGFSTDSGVNLTMTEENLSSNVTCSKPPTQWQIILEQISIEDVAKGFRSLYKTIHKHEDVSKPRILHVLTSSNYIFRSKKFQKVCAELDIIHTTNLNLGLGPWAE